MSNYNILFSGLITNLLIWLHIKEWYEAETKTREQQPNVIVCKNRKDFIVLEPTSIISTGYPKIYLV